MSRAFVLHPVDARRPERRLRVLPGGGQGSGGDERRRRRRGWPRLTLVAPPQRGVAADVSPHPAFDRRRGEDELARIAECAGLATVARSRLLRLVLDDDDDDAGEELWLDEFLERAAAVLCEQPPGRTPRRLRLVTTGAAG